MQGNIVLLWFVGTHIRTCVLLLFLYCVSESVLIYFASRHSTKSNLSSLLPLLFPLIEHHPKYLHFFIQRKKYLIKALHTLVIVFSSFY